MLLHQMAILINLDIKIFADEVLIINVENRFSCL